MGIVYTAFRRERILVVDSDENMFQRCYRHAKHVCVELEFGAGGSERQPGAKYIYITTRADLKENRKSGINGKTYITNNIAPVFIPYHW